METKDLDQLKPNPKNPRFISKEDFEALKNSIRKFGDLSGIIYNKASNQLAGGHQRIEAFKAIGGQKKVTITQRFDSPNKHGTVAVGYVTLDNEFYAYREVDWPIDSVDAEGNKYSSIEVAANIAANRISGQFDQDMLAQLDYELNKLENGDELLSLTGQTESEISKLLDMVGANGEGNPEDDEAPPIDDVNPAVSRLGEIYQLGRHRLMCGDSTDFGSVSDLMDGAVADMVFTDPPYGMNFDPNMSDNLQSAKGKWKTKINNYSNVIGDNKPFDYKQFDWLECKEQFWWGGDYYSQTLPADGSWFVWDKRAGIEDIKWSTSEFELCWSKQHHHREILRYRWFGALGMEAEADGRNGRVHPTQKPLELCGYIIKKFSKQNNTILDLFLGSGSTLITCEQIDRTCYGMELDPKYCDVIRKRFAKYIDQEDWIAASPVIQSADNV